MGQQTPAIDKECSNSVCSIFLAASHALHRCSYYDRCQLSKNRYL